MQRMHDAVVGVQREGGERVNTLYTFGYLSSKSQRILKELTVVRTPVVDIRFEPTSRRYEWTREALENNNELNYFWIKALGNELYKEAINGKFQEPRVKIHDAEKGIEELGKIIDRYKRAAIFCACNNKTCHRFMVAKMAEEKLKVKVVHL